jgi:hypothetical protein
MPILLWVAGALRRGHPGIDILGTVEQELQAQYLRRLLSPLLSRTRAWSRRAGVRGLCLAFGGMKFPEEKA